jgi:hypothetical protein
MYITMTAVLSAGLCAEQGAVGRIYADDVDGLVHDEGDLRSERAPWLVTAVPHSAVGAGGPHGVHAAVAALPFHGPWRRRQKIAGHDHLRSAGGDGSGACVVQSRS